MGYSKLAHRLQRGDTILLDGGTGTELERRGVPMDIEAWCGLAALAHGDVLEQIHCDYIAAGADVITANTYASSRLRLAAAGYGDQFATINRAAIDRAHRARETMQAADVLVAGSLSHRGPVVSGTARPDVTRRPSEAEMADAFSELALLLRDSGCDLILLEMMYYPERIPLAFKAAAETGLPVWAGFSGRRGADGACLSFAPDRDIPVQEIFQVLQDYDIDAAGMMHTNAEVIGDSLKILREVYDGPLLAYPDSGFFKSPHWQFEAVMPPQQLHHFAEEWLTNGTQIVGGCCGISPEHIAALKPLKA